jgi:hypothetical protein
MDSDYHGVGVGERGQIDVIGGEGYGDVRPFFFCDWTFDIHMVYFPVVIPTLLLAFEVCARTLGNGEDCPMGWEGFVLQLGFLDLRRRWRWWVVFNLNLGVAILLWIGDLRDCCRVCHLRSWWGYVICKTCEGCE